MKRFLPLGALIIFTIFGASYYFKNNTQFIDDLKSLSHGTLANLEIFEDLPLAPNTGFKDREGKDISLRSFGGKVVVANFWATWCVPCRVEMPDLERLARKVDPEKIRVITISLDRKGFEVIDPFLGEIGVTDLEVYLDRSNKLSLEVGALGIPTTLIIGPNSEMVGRLVGPAIWHEDDVIAFLEKVYEGGN